MHKGNDTKPNPATERDHPVPPIAFGLIHPGEPGNAGASARSLTAFGFHDLYLIAPRVLPGRADSLLAVRWACATLRDARLVAEGEIDALLKEFPEIWGTTARPGHHRHLERPEELVADYVARGAGRLLILFGPERDGLSRGWLDRCHRLIHFPTPGGPLNLAHAVTIMGYELRRQLSAQPPARREQASPRQRERILERAAATLDLLAYPARSLKRHPPEAYLEPVRSGPLSARQARWLLGLLRRLEQRLAPADQRGKSGAARKSKA
ncbi:MAG: TrmH family RNA methyltransferase [Candidatus Eisenbacteria bacterium]